MVPSTSRCANRCNPGTTSSNGSTAVAGGGEDDHGRVGQLQIFLAFAQGLRQDRMAQGPQIDLIGRFGRQQRLPAFAQTADRVLTCQSRRMLAQPVE